MYEFNKEEIDFFKRFGQTGNGKSFLDIIKRVRNSIDKTSSIIPGSDYGAQVEGRKLATGFFGKIIDEMDPREKKSTGFVEEGVDDYS